MFPVWAYWKVNMLVDPQWKTQACVHKCRAELFTVSASPEGQYSSQWESNGLLTHPKKETVQNRLFRSSVYLSQPQPKCIPSTRGVQKPLFVSVSVSVSVTVKAGLHWHNKHQQPQTDKYFLGFIVVLSLCCPCWWLLWQCELDSSVVQHYKNNCQRFLLGQCEPGFRLNNIYLYIYLHTHIFIFREN